MSEPVAEDNVKSSQQEESESLIENGVEADVVRDTRGSTLESVHTGTQSSESKQFKARPIRERILRQRKQINYAEPADNPLKDTVRIQSNTPIIAQAILNLRTGGLSSSILIHRQMIELH
jgi:hypothetical protein